MFIFFIFLISIYLELEVWRDRFKFIGFDRLSNVNTLFKNKMKVGKSTFKYEWKIIQRDNLIRIKNTNCEIRDMSFMFYSIFTD